MAWGAVAGGAATANGGAAVADGGAAARGSAAMGGAADPEFASVGFDAARGGAAGPGAEALEEAAASVAAADALIALQVYGPAAHASAVVGLGGPAHGEIMAIAICILAHLA